MNWRFRLSNDVRKRIELEHEPTTDAEKINLCEYFMSVCERLNKYAKIIDDFDLCAQILELGENFEFLRDLHNGAIDISEWDDYTYEGDFSDWFDGYLSEFWDICDTPIGENEKFCVVEF